VSYSYPKNENNSLITVG